MSEASLSAAIADWLAMPAAYPQAPAQVERIETHISRVFLAGERVYKQKKPVRFDFLDFSTAALRERACREELRLNRRLSPDMYLDVLPVVRGESGAFALGGAGPPLDWVVVMRRLPTDQTLEAQILRGDLQPESVDRLAQTLIAFYRRLPPLRWTAEAYVERCQAHVRGNQRELLAARHRLPRGSVERVHAFQLQALSLGPELFGTRVEQGRIVEGHGDLRPEHICLTEPPAIFDCLEFSFDFRRIDIADELCFLAAECDLLGAPWVGVRLLARYAAATGDEPPSELLAFYKSYRACVRAKVAALREDQTAGAAQHRAHHDAAQHLALADEYVAPFARPLVLAVGGLSGTGKTTLATALAERLGAELLRTDVVRRELFSGERGLPSPPGGVYSAEARELVYGELFRLAAALHAEGISVVLDATFSSAGALRAAQALAIHPRAVFLAIECACPAELARQRIATRMATGSDASEARPETHDAQRQTWEPWPQDIPQVRSDTSRPLADQVAIALTALQPIFQNADA